MIPPRRSRPFSSFFAWHARKRVARTFESLRVRGLDDARARLARAPLLVVSNHTSWWDPLMAIVVSHQLGAEAYAMMDARNLRRLPFFAWIGAFGVDLDDPRDGARAIRLAAKLLDRPGKLVWIFAQGEERLVTERPLAFRAGSAEVARLAKHADVIPVGLRYEMGGVERPTAMVSIGPSVPRSHSRDDTRVAQERAVEHELDEIEAALRVRTFDGFAATIHGTRQPLAALSEAWLSRISRALQR